MENSLGIRKVDEVCKRVIFCHISLGIKLNIAIGLMFILIVLSICNLFLK